MADAVYARFLAEVEPAGVAGLAADALGECAQDPQLLDVFGGGGVCCRPRVVPYQRAALVGTRGTLITTYITK